MLKPKLPYFGHLMWRADSLEKTLMVGKIEGRRRWGQQRMRLLDGITNSKDMSLSKLWEILDREAYHTAVQEVKKSWTQFSNWITTSILAWEILWTEERGYHPWGPKRVGYDVATEQQKQTFSSTFYILSSSRALQYLLKMNSLEYMRISISLPWWMILWGSSMHIVLHCFISFSPNIWSSWWICWHGDGDHHQILWNTRQYCFPRCMCSCWDQ